MPSAAEGIREQPNTIRVLIATDNHVGYEERDPIRKDDSWKTFDEILKIASDREVDMVLLGGDLFHDNKPSRKSMYQVMRSLRKHCLGMKPCPLEFLSDANEVFEGAFPHVNYEDPDINISLPVFSIHGNHDDPSGDGHFCSLDLLQVAGLVNYFGRVPEANDIHVKPVLLQKGDTKLALYGISNVRDERLFRTFRDNNVTFYRPPDDDGKFFNLLTVHQNHTAHTSTSYLPESVLPEWMNLVVWGHEHDCQIEPAKNPETGFFVMQPGSSVATSLIKGEAEPQKQVAIVSITGEEFKSEAITLKTVRPLVYREIVLRNEEKFKRFQHEKDHREKLSKKLMGVVDEMIKEATQDWVSKQDQPENVRPEEIPLPLIRLKVEHSADDNGSFDVENPQRFSNRFQGKVANVNDVVSFHRKKSTTKHKSGDVKMPGAIKDAIENEEIIKIDVLVREFLQNSSLKVLPANQFEDAVLRFIEKGGKETLDEFVNEALSKSLNFLVKIDDTKLDQDMESAIEQCRERLEARFAQAGGKPWAPKRKLKPKPVDYDSDLAGHWDDPAHPDRWELIARPGQDGEHGGDGEDDAGMFVDDVAFTDAPATSAPVRGAAVKSGRGGAAASAGATSRGGAAKKAAAPKTRGRLKKQTGFLPDSDEEEEEEEQAQDDPMSLDDFDDDEEEEEAPAPPPKRASRSTKATTTRTTTSRTTKPAATKTKQSTLNFSQSQAAPSRSRVNQTQKSLVISDDEIDDDDDDDDDAFEPPVSTRSSRRR